MMKYREQLAKYCDRPGYSRSRVGLDAGYNKNYVGGIIKGDITPTIDALDALAKVLDVPLAVLLFGDDTDATTLEIVSKMQGIDMHGKRAVNALVDSLSTEKKTPE